MCIFSRICGIVLSIYQKYIYCKLKKKQGHDESGGDLVEKNGSWFKSFYGMSSSVAMQKHAGGVANYRSSEGKAITVPYRGPVSATLKDILGGIRSSCTYVGAAHLEELPMKTIFIRVSMQVCVCVTS
jgi:GMP reductase